MKEQFQTILDNEELDSKAKVEEIARIVGEQTVIKSKFNEQLSKYKEKDSELEQIKEELEAIKTSNMTEGEKIAKAEKIAKEKEIEFTKKINKLDAEKQLINAGLKEEDYKDLIDNLVSEDAENTAKRIAGIAELLTKQKEQVANITKEELLKNTPRPEETSNQNSTVMTKEDFKKLGGWEKAELFKSNRELFDELTK